MPAAHWDESSDDLDDFEYPDTTDPSDEDTDTVVCPECGADVYEDADQCPVCGHYMTADTRIWAGRPNWWIILALLGIIAVILTLVFGQ